MKKYLSISLIFLSIFQSVFSNDNNWNYTTAYDFNFTMDSCTIFPWSANAAYSRSSRSIFIPDSDKKLFTQFYLTDYNGYWSDMLQTELEQRILLPVSQEKYGSISFICKGESLDYSLLEVEVFNNEEKIIYKDTVKWTPDKQFKEISLNIPLKDAAILGVRIYAQGLKRVNAAFIFSRMGIKIGNKTIDEFPLCEFYNDIEIQDEALIELKTSTNEGFDKIKKMNTTVVALGEAMHGNNAIKKMAQTILTNQARSGNCKVILIEMPFEQSLSFNRYILDDKFILDSLQIEYLKSKGQLDFLNRLKVINASRAEKDKVELLGFDYRYNFDPRIVNEDLFDYIYELNRIEKNRTIDSLNILLMKYSLSTSYNYFIKRKTEMKRFFKENDYNYLTHIYGIAMQMEHKDPATRFLKRDSIMFANVDFIMNRLDRTGVKVYIYGHSLHLNPISTYPAAHCLPLGYYLNASYSDNYSVYLLTIGSGENRTESENYVQTITPLKIAPYGSIEYLLSRCNYSQFYLSVTPEFNRLFLTRVIGLNKIPKEFTFTNIFQRYKGIFFIKHDEANPISNTKLITYKETLGNMESSLKIKNLRLDEILERQNKKTN